MSDLLLLLQSGASQSNTLLKNDFSNNEQSSFDFSKLFSSDSSDLQSNFDRAKQEAVDREKQDVVTTELFLNGRNTVQESKDNTLEEDIQFIEQVRTAKKLDLSKSSFESFMNSNSTERRFCENVEASLSPKVLTIPEVYYASIASGKMVFSSQDYALNLNEKNTSIVENAVRSELVKGNASFGLKQGPSVVNRVIKSDLQQSLNNISSNVYQSSTNDVYAKDDERQRWVQNNSTHYNIDEYQRRNLMILENNQQLKLYYRDYGFKGDLNQLKSDLTNYFFKQSPIMSIKVNGQDIL
ncbi:hypothetical protein [Pleionea sediminis]|uniref:hypothetical protein n=1 Tax=Pleionea sediminis TaxID=2569479 RepID=UPI001185F9CB|nr:hypothetical protein [Pleionea sediminis]